jgi:hypothetical protein
VGVAESCAEKAALSLDLVVLDSDPREEGVDVRTEMLVAKRLDLGVGSPPPRSIELEDPRDAGQAFACDDVLGDGRFPELGPDMRLMSCSA